jgi:hypothetical protein
MWLSQVAAVAAEIMEQEAVQEVTEQELELYSMESLTLLLLEAELREQDQVKAVKVVQVH